MIMRNGGIILAAFGAFAIVHSLLAGIRPKERLKTLFGDRFVEGWYRLAYNGFSILTILPVMGAIMRLPDRLLYQLEPPWSIMLRILQALGIAGLVGALFVTDVWQFAGFKQVAAFVSGDPLPLPVPPLQETGMYRFVRHPLYFFSLLVVWATPSLSVNGFWFNVAVTLYVIFGSLVEERRMLLAYGDTYRQYRTRVSWLIPWFPTPQVED